MRTSRFSEAQILVNARQVAPGVLEQQPELPLVLGRDDELAQLAV